MMSEETWKQGLMYFYFDCVNYWSTSFKLGEDDSIKMAIKDCVKITAWPFSPQGPKMPEEIHTWYQDWLKSEEFYLKPLSREGVNRILNKLPGHKYWLAYKAYDD